MTSDKPWYVARLTERIFLLLVSALIGVLFYQLHTVLQKDFNEVSGRLANGSIMNLNTDKPGERMRRLLQQGHYFKDPADINLVSNIIDKGLSARTEPIDNIGELNKRNYNLPAEMAYANGGQNFRQRVKVSRTLIGFSDADSTLYDQEKRRPLEVPTANSLDMGKGAIEGQILTRDNQPARGVLVRLRMILPEDSVYSNTVDEIENVITQFKGGVRKVFAIDSVKNRQLMSLTAYSRTDNRGNFVFLGLLKSKAYEILPLQPGFQFGRSKGVTSLENNASFQFVQSPHTIKLFSTKDFSNLKKEKSFIVRTPGEADTWFWIILGGFIASFFILHLVLTARFPKADQLLLPIIMLLVGLSLITLLSLQDPLRDRFLAKSTFFYFLGGIGGFFVMILFNIRFFTPDSMLYRLFVFKSNRKAANGWPWALVAMGLLVLTIIFGTGPEGSGVRGEGFASPAKRGSACG